MSNDTFEKYKAVVDEWYINGFNRKKAYSTVFNCETDSTCEVNSSKIFKYDCVKRYIEEKRAKALEITEETHTRILTELLNIVYCDITETIGLTPDEVKALPSWFKRCIQAYKMTERDIYDTDGNIKATIRNIDLKLVPKSQAWDMINKHVGFYGADNQQQNKSVSIYAKDAKHAEIVKKILEGG